MASSSLTLVKLSCAIILCIMIVAPHGEALTCGQVASGLSPCIAYLMGRPGPSTQCCGGLRALVGLARTKADRQAACQCLKGQSSAIKGINFAKAAGLPGMCRVRVPYAISPSTNCNNVS